MGHHYIKPCTPRLNGKVERSHLTDEQEFHQLLEYTDVDLNSDARRFGMAAPRVMSGRSAAY